MFLVNLRGEIYVNFNPEKVLNTLSGYCLGLGWFPDDRGGFENVLGKPQKRGPAKSNKEFKASMHIPPPPCGSGLFVLWVGDEAPLTRVDILMGPLWAATLRSELCFMKLLMSRD